MAMIEGTHSRAGGGPPVHYRVEYEVVASAIHFRATFTPGEPHEGEFDFDPSKLDADAAVDAFMHDHIAKSDRDISP